MKRNITIQLDENTIRQAKIVAAKRSTSLSRVVAQEITRAAQAVEGYEAAKSAALYQLRHPFDLGGQGLPLDRDSLHER